MAFAAEFQFGLATMLRGRRTQWVRLEPLVARSNRLLCGWAETYITPPDGRALGKFRWL